MVDLTPASEREALDRVTFHDGVLDEIVLTDAAVHLEQMDDKTWCLIIDRDRIQINVTVSKARIFVFEVNGQLWPDGANWPTPNTPTTEQPRSQKDTE